MSNARARYRIGLTILVTAISIAACSETRPQGESSRRPSAEEARLAVYVVNYPLQYFAERIGGENVEVRFPAPHDGDPAFWMPDAETVGVYQQADLILLNGANYAKWVGRVSLPQAKLVNTSLGFQDQYMLVQNAVIHAHGPKGEHSHGDIAFTTWLDPKLAVEQARAITQAFVKSRPDQKESFEDGFTNLERDLLDLDQEISNIVSTNPSQPLVASHPVFQYLTRRYGLNVKTVHWEPDEVPDDRKWREFTDILAAHPAQWMIWEGEPNPATVAKLKSMGITSVVFDPCGNVPEKGDFLSVMQQNVENLKRAFR